MADPESNARPRAAAGAPTSGVIHVRTRLTADFTVVSNALAQRRGSAVTIGVAVYVQSLPSGTPVTIAALCAHFTEGEILISRALRELEAAGYLERRRERLPSGQIRTRTYFYDVPCGDRPRPARRPSRDQPVAPAVPEAAEEPQPSLSHTDDDTHADADADPRALAVLAALQRVDPRLLLTVREAARLAPAVSRWLAAGLHTVQIVKLLTEGLPDHFLTRPAGLLAYRLREAPLPAPPSAPASRGETPTVHPFQTCDSCDRAFRAPAPGRCRGCRSGSRLHAA
ncbi:hypothetical protein ACG2OD_18145 [Streptomyces sp. PDY-4]|uniref:hypothetical protein n=1 Tax=Streptomyces sp. PDY-4 TaxID=3376070 RepID=UPI0037A944CF